jgi:hypothetical protein
MTSRTILLRDGITFAGDAVTIVQAMKAMAFGVDHLALAEYIDVVAANALKFDAVTLDVNGANEAAKAEALVVAMLASGLAVEA